MIAAPEQAILSSYCAANYKLNVGKVNRVAEVTLDIEAEIVGFAAI